MQQHLEQSVLSKLPDSYQSFLKQSTISEEDDMGKIDTANLVFFFSMFSLMHILAFEVTPLTVHFWIVVVC